MLQRAFSLVELLAVMTIIAILGSLLMAGLQGLQRSTLVVRTETIIETLRQAIELTTTERGSPLIPAQHPLAASRGQPAAPRLLFQRDPEEGGTLLSGASRSESAIRGLNLDQVPASYRDRVLLDNDFFADPLAPGLFGLRRERMGYLGANLAPAYHYHLLPRPRDTAYNSAQMQQLLADPRYVQSSNDGPSANALLLDYVLGSTTAKTELSKLDSRSHLNELDALYLAGGDAGSSIVYGRLWTPSAIGPAASWQPGHVQDPENGQWRRYRIPGLAVYDSWGNEILYSLSRSGVVRLMSAGPDGAFMIHPGENGIIDSEAAVASPSGDDRDASADNIILVTDHG